MGYMKELAIEKENRENDIKKKIIDMIDHHLYVYPNAYFGLEYINSYINMPEGRLYFKYHIASKVITTQCGIVFNKDEDSGKLVTPKTVNDDTDYWSSDNIPKPVERVCTCDSFDLFHYGCRCGAIKRYDANKGWK